MKTLGSLIEAISSAAASARGFAIAAAVKGPGAAERTVPRTATGKLDGCARVERADKIFIAAPAQMAGGHEAVEVIDHFGRRPVAFSRHNPGQLADAAAANRLYKLLGDGLSFASDHAIDSAFGVFQNVRQ